MDHFVYVCPQCYRFFISNGQAIHYNCKYCGAPLDRVQIAYSEYASMSGETLRAFKEQYIQQNYIDRAADVVYQKKTKPFSPKRNGWAMLIRIAGWFMIALFLIAAVIVYMLKPGWLSFLFAIGLVLSGFLSMAGIMLLASFFDDVREIRNSIEAYVRSHM